MVFMFAMPVFTGFANCIMPLQIGAPDMAFPRLNALSLWLFLGGGFLLCLGFFTNDGAADFGWTGYAPLSTSGTVGSGGDLWVMGDNRGDSSDSRAHQSDPDGPFVPVSDVVGKVFAVIWPLGHLKVVHRPGLFDKVPAPATTGVALPITR